MRRRIIKCFLPVLMCITILAACSGGGITETPVNVTAAITAGSNLNSFTYHAATAYWANFGAAGVSLSGATSSVASGLTITAYSWEHISGPAVTITSDTTSQTVTFDVPVMTSILSDSDKYRWQPLPISTDDAKAVFRLTVTASSGEQSVTTFTVHLFDNGSELVPTTGLTNVGVTQKVYLQGPSLKANSSTASTDVTDWAWVLTPPAGSAATLSNAAAQVANFTPDIAGSYTVTYTSATAGAAGTITVTASSFVGIGTIADETPSASAGQCGACHTSIDTEWHETGHSSIFEQVIGYYKNYAPEPYCWECHTTGYDDDAGVSNGNFADLVEQEGYSFPSAGTTWNAFTTDNPTLTTLTNVQCENCHGPGSIHTGTFSNWDAGICGRCHSQEAEWKISAHNSTGVTATAGRYRLTSWPGVACARCHTGAGFMEYAAGEEVTAQTSDDVGIVCQSCHEPHSVEADTPSGPTNVSGNDSTQLRLKGTVTMKDDAGTQVDAGKAAVCYTCHDGYYVKGEVDCDADGDGTAEGTCDTIDQVATQYFRQVHGNPQSFVLEGVGVVTAFSNSAYDFTLTENSFHSSSLFTLRAGTGEATQSDENNKCVTCHMGTAPEEDETGYRLIGGHTWKMSSGSIKFLAACSSCHSGLADFNRAARADYDGDGSVEGIQDEIKGLLLALTSKIKSIDTVNVSGGTTADADGNITVGNLSYANQAAMNASPIDVRRAVYNHNVISKDGSLGVHNMAFAVQLLQKTYTAISGLNGGNSFTGDYPNAILR